MQSLTTTEIRDFERLEKVVEAGQKTFVDVGLALTEIRDRKLYRQDFKTWEEYCQKRWGWSQRRSHQLIEAAAVVESLSKESGTAVPLLKSIPNEAVARELAKIPPPQRKQIVEEAAKENKPLTAPAVRSKIPPPARPPTKVPPPPSNRDRELEVKKLPDVFDACGYPIPKELVSIWERASEVQKLLNAISEVRSTLRDAQEQKDVLYTEVNFSEALADLNRAYTNIKTAKPYAVCSCGGMASRHQCRLCKGRGLISFFRWDKQVPEEVKNIRFKSRK